MTPGVLENGQVADGLLSEMIFQPGMSDGTLYIQAIASNHTLPSP